MKKHVRRVTLAVDCLSSISRTEVNAAITRPFIVDMPLTYARGGRGAWSLYADDAQKKSRQTWYMVVNAASAIRTSSVCKIFRFLCVV